MKNLSQLRAEDIQIEDNEVKNLMAEFLSKYGTPSFGSMSKRDLDILLFDMMQKLGIIEGQPNIYSVMRKLNITRSKARNLIYETAIRKTLEDNALDDMLREKIAAPIFAKNGERISIEIDNPLLIDHLRSKLKELGHLTDGSFHAEIVAMTPDAFADLYAELLPQEKQDEIYNRFVQLGVARERGARPFVKAAIKCVAHAALGKAGDELVDSAKDIVGKWIHGVVENIPLNAPAQGSIYERILEA